MEDRFMTVDMMVEVSKALEAAGFEHVVSAHLIDPKWRGQYRGSRPELEPVAWTVHLPYPHLPMDKVKALIEICEPRGLVFWLTSSSDKVELYTLKIAHPQSGAMNRM